MILASDIGQNASSRLSCHTDLESCCRSSDTEDLEPLGEWYYPDGRVVQNKDGAKNSSETFYRGRNLQTVNLLNRQELNSMSPTGSYCCVVPTAGGELVTFCASISKCAVSSTKTKIE